MSDNSASAENKLSVKNIKFKEKTSDNSLLSKLHIL